MSSAIAPVAAEIMPGRPPVKAMITAMEKEAYKPTFGSTPAIIEKAMASGINASATTSPASRSFLVLENHACLSDDIANPELITAMEVLRVLARCGSAER